MERRRLIATWGSQAGWWDNTREKETWGESTAHVLNFAENFLPEPLDKWSSLVY